MNPATGNGNLGQYLVARGADLPLTRVTMLTVTINGRTARRNCAYYIIPVMVAPLRPYHWLVRPALDDIID
jgi:hypothetical protein